MLDVLGRVFTTVTQMTDELANGDEETNTGIISPGCLRVCILCFQALSHWPLTISL